MTRQVLANAPGRGQERYALSAGTVGADRAGVVLLEVVLAIVLFFGGALVILCGLQASLRTAERVRLEAEAADLAVSLLSEVQMGFVELTDDGPNDYEDEELVGWTWEIVASPVDETPEAPPLLRVELIVRYEPAQYAFRLVHLMPEQQQPEEGSEAVPLESAERGLR